MRLRGKIVPFSLACLLALALIPAAGAEPAEPDWISLPYLQHGYGGWFRIWTNQDTFLSGKRVTGGDTSAFGNPYPGPTPEENKPTEFQALWGGCKAVDAQTFKTTREVYLPGLPDKLQTSLGAWSQASSLSPPRSPIDSVELVVNGISVAKVKSSPGHLIPYFHNDRKIIDIKSAPLVYGLNKFTVIAHKKVTKKSLGYCTSYKFGAVAEVYGEFLADMGVSKEAVGTHRSDLVTFDTTITNKGPSDLIPGWSSFMVQAQSQSEKVSQLAVFDIPGCGPQTPYVDGAADGLRVICPLDRMMPAAQLTAHVQIRWDPPGTPGASTNFFYGVQGYGEIGDEIKDDSEIFTLTVTP